MKYVEHGGIQFDGVKDIFYPRHGYGNARDEIDGVLTYSQDYTTKTRLLDIIENPRITNRGEDVLLSFLMKIICTRRFTLMEARRIKGISVRKRAKHTILT